MNETIDKIKKRIEGIIEANVPNNNNTYEVKYADGMGYESLSLYINHQLYLIITLQLSGFSIRLVEKPQDYPVYSVNIQNESFIQVFNYRKKVNSSFHDFYKLEKDVFDIIFSFPKNQGGDKDIIITELNKVLSIRVSKDLIAYDLRSQTYYLKDWEESTGAENNFLKTLFPEPNTKEESVIAKYTSFETFFEILKSGKMRVNSLICMNDRSELNFVDQFLYDKKMVSEYTDETFGYLYNANQNFITSFSGKIDSLDMWRLYGNDLAGVCMVFKYYRNWAPSFLYPVNYVDESPKEREGMVGLERIKHFLSILKQEDISFTFNSLTKWGYFFKSVDYDYENEYRLLLERETPTGWMLAKSTNILTPYIDLLLKKDYYSSLNDSEFPLYLNKVILGTKLPSAKENIYQIYRMIKSNGFRFDVEMSKINHYR